MASADMHWIPAQSWHRVLPEAALCPECPLMASPHSQHLMCQVRRRQHFPVHTITNNGHVSQHLIHLHLDYCSRPGEPGFYNVLLHGDHRGA